MYSTQWLFIDTYAGTGGYDVSIRRGGQDSFDITFQGSKDDVVSELQRLIEQSQKAIKEIEHNENT